uniref:NADH dehydrogenase subunit 6 n=1 Tax=Centrotypus laticornis TaxID=2980484 RepID=UPI0028FCA64B|nr:NADH dehydrogenase subunit 6 [Centrotypus laticornis]UXF57641.1 NADH dehydrogenase subunit 6 [Centrotypus laticornis]
MKMMLIKTMMVSSMMTSSMKKPMSMGIMLMIQTTWTIMLMNTINNSSWIPLITFLIMMGGLLVIFLYMSSITSNEKFKMNYKLSLMIIIMMIPHEELMLSGQNFESEEILTKSKEMISMSKMYSKSMIMTMLMIMYLMLTMITINKIVKTFEGPLRSKTYE